MSVALSDYGNLHLIFGPMFSGKSTEGIRRIRQYAVLYSSKVILCVKFSGDNRYTEKAKVYTHDRTELKASSCSSLDELGEDWRKYKAIFIDEGQFFPDIVEFVKKALEFGVNIIVSGLDGDYQKKPFENNWLCLIPYATHAKKLKAICKCGKSAAFTSRITQEKGQNLIGGSDKYEARCGQCYTYSE